MREIKQVDWEALERECASFQELPDCIPTNAREWSNLKAQYSNLVTLDAMVSDGTYGTASVPDFFWDHVLGGHPYKKSLSEIDNDTHRLSSIRAMTHDKCLRTVWEKHVGDMIIIRHSCIVKYLKNTKQALFKVGDYYFTIDRSGILSSIENFKKLDKNKTHSYAKRAPKLSIGRNVGFTILDSLLGTDLDEQHGIIKPKISAIINSGAIYIENGKMRPVLGRPIVKFIQISKFSDFMRIYKQNSYAYYIVEDIVPMELLDAYDEMAAAIQEHFIPII